MRDERIPAADDCLVRDLVERWAQEMPDKVAILFEDGSSWDYRELRRQVLRFAAGLQSLGVKQGDFVLACLANGPHMIALWYALNYIGAVFVPVNPASRGAALAHVIELSDAALMVIDGAQLQHLPRDGAGKLRKVVHIGAVEGSVPPGLEVLPEAALTQAGEQPAALERLIQPWDLMVLIFTSGTTGASKGVLISCAQAYIAARSFWWVTEADRALVSLPMYHTGGIYPMYRALVAGGSFAVISAFSTSTFWATVERTEATTLTLLGAMVSFLVRQPVTPGEREHTLKSANIVPINADSVEFGERFGVDYYSHFGMTEISPPVVTERNPKVFGSAGKVRDGVQARVVDANDCEVPHGETGELIIRCDVPWSMTHAYHKDPEATARAWRNGWFHTGDGFRRDAEGNFFYVDRIKDAIRRRGENISAFEVEREVMAHGSVADTAVVAVKSQHGEDDVLCVVVLQPQAQLDPAQLLEFLAPRMAHYMLPRFVRIVAALPRTPTHKVQKYLLRELTADTWDRESAGIQVKREAMRARALT